MKFENTFRVAAPPRSVWEALMDFERVVPCMPGAEVLERKPDDAYEVQVRVKVGPMSMVYRGGVEITERDEEELSASMRVHARETRGQGTANATVEIKLAANGSVTEAAMATDLRLSGRAAAMGRGVIGDVSQALVSEFANNLAGLLSADAGPSSEVGASSDPAGPISAVAASPPPVPAGHAAASPPPTATASPPPAEPSALDAGQLAKDVLAGRLRDPRTAVSALFGAACMAVGFLFGRARGRH
jgi:carbon monoxide dehydrogenase subunit G